MENRLFASSLILSFFLHLFVLGHIPGQGDRLKRRPRKTIEVIYPGIVLEKRAPMQEPPPVKGMKVDLMQAAKASLQEQQDLASLLKDMSKLSDNFMDKGQKPKALAPKSPKRRVSVPAVDIQQITNPLYIDYYQIVRSRIRDRAYANYAKLDSGEVYLTFILDARGVLKRIKVIEERTRANQYLRQISARSVEESSPFPPFPKELQYPELSFNVVISYEVE